MPSHDFLRKRIPFFKKIATNIIHCNVAFTIDEMDILYLVKLRPQSAARKKLVATANRREGVYNRAGEPSVTFCGKGGAVTERTKKPSHLRGFNVQRSLLRRGAPVGIRTQGLPLRRRTLYPAELQVHKTALVHQIFYH